MALKFLRLLRLMRMMKIARYFSGMRNMLRKTSKSLQDIGPFAGLLFIFIYLFTLIGRELFAYKAALDEDGEIIYGAEEIEKLKLSGREIRYPRVNFNTFFSSMTAVFILINGEDWIWTAQDWVRAYGAGSRIDEAIATAYFLLLMLIGHLTLFALFTGILLHSFGQYHEIKDETIATTFMERMHKLKDQVGQALTRQFEIKEPEKEIKVEEVEE